MLQLIQGLICTWCISFYIFNVCYCSLVIQALVISISVPHVRNELSRCVRKFKHIPGEASPHFFSSFLCVFANPVEDRGQLGIEEQLWRQASGSGDRLRWVLFGDNWWAGKDRRKIQDSRNQTVELDTEMQRWEDGAAVTMTAGPMVTNSCFSLVYINCFLPHTVTIK